VVDRLEFDGLTGFASRSLPSSAAEFVPTCGPQFAGMLACWATSGDLRNAGPCIEASKRLTMCLKSPVSLLGVLWLALVAS
jgi:hypothetical protein